ncbi:MAG: TonB-dependent receptor [Saprospiraceae bacterium]|nr:TonB-dependent receptor [Saprospiraceae bacterium]
MMSTIYLRSIFKYLFLSLFLILQSRTAYAQNDASFRLLDETNDQPIAGALWQYDHQKGTSDADGLITFQSTGEYPMFISHVAYGAWEIAYQELNMVIARGSYSLPMESQVFFPATIVALRPKADEVIKRDLSYEEKMAHDAGALLVDIPGISSIRKSGGYGFDPVVRGFKYDQVNIVLDGVQSAVAACPNRMDPPTSQMAPNMIDRIEVLKGPHQLRFGNAFGATINFAGTTPAFSEAHNIYGRISGGYESNGSLLRSEGQLGFSGRNYDLGFFASWSEGHDYKAGNGSLVQADFLRGSFGSNLGFKISTDQLVKISVIRNLARDADFPSLMMDLRDDDTWLLKAQHEIKFSHGYLKSLNTAFFGSLVDHLMNNKLKNLNPRMMNASTNATTNAMGGRSEAHWQYGNGSLYTGIDIRADQAEGIREREFLLGPNAGKTVYDNAWQNGRITKSAFFSEYQYQKNSWQLVFSGRMELNQGKITDPQPEFTEINTETSVTQFNPSFSLGGIKNFDSNIALGLWMGRAQRSGGLTERFINYLTVGLDPYELVGNPALKPEVNNQIDLTFQFRRNNLSLNVDLFASYLQDFITSRINTALNTRLPNSPGVRQFINLDKALLTGGEIELNHTLSQYLTQRFSVAYTYGKDITRAEPLPEIAPLELRYHLKGKIWKKRLQPEIGLREVLEQSRISPEYGETVTPGFFVADFSLKYQIIETLKITTGVQNIFDVNYYEHLTRATAANRMIPVYAPGRSYTISVSVDLR